MPRADANLVPLPDAVTDEQAIIASDVFPTGYFAARLAEVTPGDTVAVFGCGPVGQLAVASARHLGATRVFAVDRDRSRLEKARRQHAEPIDFDAEDPVEVIRELTGGIGADRVIDAVGLVYPQTAASWPIGIAMNRNLTVRAGNCPHRALLPELIDIIAAGQLDPGRAVTEQEGITDAVAAYRTFDAHQPGWVKVANDPAA